MKQGHTAILIALDETASMESVRDATISAFNEFMQDQRKVKGSAELWLLRFNTCVALNDPKQWGDLGQVPDLSRDTYRPACNTPLYDAVGNLIDLAGKNFGARAEHEQPEKVVCVIQTDGEENSSREYTADRVKSMIGHQRSTYGWQFMFLGAAQDAWMAGQMIGIAAAQTLSYDQDPQSAKAAFVYTSNSVAGYRSAGTAMAYDDTDIREKRAPKN